VLSVEPRDAMNNPEQPGLQETSYVEKTLGLVTMFIPREGAIGPLLC